MDALDALLNRVSAPRLCEPAPDAGQRELLFRAALRAPDHGQLRPWRFLTIEGAAREQLGELLAQALPADASPEALNKARAMPLRAPLLVVVIARVHEHPKVPAQEQVIAAGCAAHGILLAAGELADVSVDEFAHGNLREGAERSAAVDCFGPAEHSQPAVAAHEYHIEDRDRKIPVNRFHLNGRRHPQAR
jgi:nitroreductase